MRQWRTFPATNLDFVAQEGEGSAGAPLSTGQEVDALVARSAALGLQVAELAPSFDVDELADVHRLRDALASDGRNCRATWRALIRLRLLTDNEGGT